MEQVASNDCRGTKAAEPAVVVRREGDSRMAVLVRVARELMAMLGAAASLSILDAAGAAAFIC